MYVRELRNLVGPLALSLLVSSSGRLRLRGWGSVGTGRTLAWGSTITSTASSLAWRLTLLGKRAYESSFQRCKNFMSKYYRKVNCINMTNFLPISGRPSSTPPPPPPPCRCWGAPYPLWGCGAGAEYPPDEPPPPPPPEYPPDEPPPPPPA